MRLKKPLALALAGGVSGGDRQYFQWGGGVVVFPLSSTAQRRALGRGLCSNRAGHLLKVAGSGGRGTKQDV